MKIAENDVEASDVFHDTALFFEYKSKIHKIKPFLILDTLFMKLDIPLFLVLKSNNYCVNLFRIGVILFLLPICTMNKISMKKILIITGILFFFLNACSDKLPENVQTIDKLPVIYPDYIDIALPHNIAPLNFEIREEGDEFFSTVRSRNGKTISNREKKVRWKLNEWKKLLEENKGDTLYFDIYVKKEKQWHKFTSITNYIAPEEIDAYFSYRLIEPSYVVYEYMTINQRNLTNFDEKIIYSNTSLSRNEDGHCINCHAFQNYNKTGKMQFHIRQYKGGTVIATPEGIKKVNLKTDYTISPGVYPAWHPTEDLIAYSVNNTEQHFHKKNKEKVEVMDSRSDLILYDIENNEVRSIANSPNELETFPTWSPDGKYLYFVSAKYPEGVDPEDEIKEHYRDFRYDIYRKSFNAETMEFSSTDTLFEASKLEKSATFPRISPDGKYLLFTLADYGNFHIWHKSSDLYLLDLESGGVSALEEANSPDVESYHSWSSNGAWILFSSRRDDGSYTRPYITYFKNGKAHKPFIVPQKDPDFYASLFKSFNIPEFMCESVKYSKRELVGVIDKDAIDTEYYGKKEKKSEAIEKAKKGFYD